MCNFSAAGYWCEYALEVSLTANIDFCKLHCRSAILFSSLPVASREAESLDPFPGVLTVHRTSRIVDQVHQHKLPLSGFSSKPMIEPRIHGECPPVLTSVSSRPTICDRCR